MAWPLSQDYNEAIQSPETSFSDAELRTGEVACNALGIPLPRSGNFADVYEVKCPNGSRWAVKCFTREVPGLRERYSEISRHLQQAKLPFTVDFSYLEQGIRVRGQWYPILKMQWVEGLTLNEFVRQYLDKPVMLEAMLQIWVKMARFLRDAQVGHCDLQHGNVLLVPGSQANSVAVKLIDYDGMWVPALAGKKSGEVGHPCYQHPQRLREGTYALEADRFPLLLIATSFRSLKTGGRTLWDKYDNGDNLLFKEADLAAPTKSALFAELVKLSDPAVKPLVNHMLEALKGGIGAAPALEEVLPTGGKVTASQQTRAARPAVAPPAAVTAAPPPVAPRANPVAPAVSPKASHFAFDEGDEGTRRPRKTKSSGSSPLPWIIAGGAALLLVAGAIGFVALGGSGKPRDDQQAGADSKIKDDRKPDKDNRPQDDRRRDQPAGDHPRDDKNGDDRPRDDKPRDDRPRDNTPRDGTRDPVDIPTRPAIIGLGRLRLPAGETLGTTWQLVMSSDGKLVLSGGDDSKARLWDADKAVLLKSWPVSGHVQFAAFSPDGKQAFFGATTVQRFDLEKDGPLREFNVGATSAIGRVALSPDAKEMLVGEWNGRVVLWDLVNDKQIREFKGHTGGISNLAFCPDGKHVLTGSKDNTIRLWSRETGEEVRKTEAHKGGLYDLVLSPDGTQILTVGNDKTVRLWDLKTGDQVQACNGHTSSPLCAAFMPDGRHFLSCSPDRTVRLWDGQTGKQQTLYEHTGIVFKIATANRRRFVMSADKSLWLMELTGGAAGTPTPIAAWDFRKDTQDHAGTLHARLVGGARLTPAGLVVDGKDSFARTDTLEKNLTEKTLEVWVRLDNLEQQGGAAISVNDPNSGNPIFDAIVFGERDTGHWVVGSDFWQRFRKLEGPAETEATKEAVHIAYTYKADGTITAYRNGKPYGQEYKKQGPVPFLKNKAYVLFGLRHYPAPSGRLNGWLAGTIVQARLYDRALTADEVAASFAGGGPAEVIKAPVKGEFKQLHDIKAHDGAIRQISVSKDGKRMLTIGADKRVCIWDVQSGKRLEAYGSASEVLSAVLLPGAKRWVMADSDKNVRLVDVEKGKEWAVVGHNDVVHALDVTPDGRWLTACSKDNAYRLADLLAPGQTIESKVMEKVLDTPATSVRLDAAAKVAIGLHSGHDVLVWRVSTDKPRQCHGIGFPKHPTGIYAVTLSRDGTVVLMGNGDGSVSVGLIEMMGGRPRYKSSNRKLPPLKGKILAVAISPDGKFWAYADDREMVLWDVAADKEASRAQPPSGISALEFSGDSQYLIVGGPMGRVHVWSLPGGGSVVKQPDPMDDPNALKSGKVTIRKHPPVSAKTTRLWRVDADSTGRVLLSSDLNGQSRVWTLDGSLKETGQFRPGEMGSAALSTDGKRLLSVNFTSRVRVWDVAAGKELRPIEDAGKQPTGAAISGDGTRGLTGDGTVVHVWNLDTGKESGRFEGHTRDVRVVYFLPGDKLALSGGEDHTWFVWNVETGKEVRHFAGGSERLMAAALSDDGKVVAFWGANQLRVWDVSNGKELQTRKDMKVPGDPYLALSPDGRVLAFAVLSRSNNDSIQFFDTRTGDDLGKFDGEGNEIGHVRFLPGGKRLLGANKKNELLLWEVQCEGLLGPGPADPALVGNQRVAEVKVRSGPSIKSLIGRQDRLAVSADGRWALSSNPSKICTWALDKEAKPLKSIKAPIPIQLGLTPDGKYALTAHVDKTLQLWDLQSDKEPRSVGETPHQVMSLSLSAKGDRAILGGSGNGQAWLWDLAAGKKLSDLKEGLGWVVTAWLPDDKHFLTGGGKTLTVRDAATGEPKRVLKGSSKSMDALAVSADGKRALTAANNGQVLLWDLEKDQEPSALAGIPEMEYLQISVAFSRDGRLAAACAVEAGPNGGGPGHLRFWDTTLGKEVGKADGPEYFLCNVAFADNVRLLGRGKMDTLEELKLLIRPATGEEKVETPTPETPQADRKPRPAEELVKDAIDNKIKKEFEKEFARLITDKSQQDLSDVLLKKATETKEDPVLRFALLQEARDLAAKGRDPARAIKAVAELAQEFDIDAVTFKAEALKLVGRPNRSDVADAILKAFVTVAVEARAADNYSSVGVLAEVIQSAKVLATPALKKSAEENLTQLQYLHKTYDAVKQAQQTLKDKPDDGDANKTVGEWHCFAKHDWDRGLPFLVKGSNAALAILAKKDLDAPTDAKEQESLGKAWENLAAKLKEPVLSEMEKRAYYWYVRATDLSAAGKASLGRLGRKYPDIQGPLDQLDLSKVKVAEGIVHLDPFRGVRSVFSRKSYDYPIEITLVARTTKNNLRMRAFQGAELIFNWEGKPGEMRVQRPDSRFKGQPGSLAESKSVPLEADKWYTIRWKITEVGMEVAVDGKVVFSELRRNELSKGAPVEVPTWDSAVDVKSFHVKAITK
jgi:WD40 repeat protein